jgi:magnesium transporter
MMRTMLRRADGSVQAGIGADDLPAALADATALLWVDFFDEPDEQCERILRDVFHFHPLAVDDALRESHVPKLDDWDRYLYLVLHAVSAAGHDGAEAVATHELDVFAGATFLVTHHEEPIPALDKVWGLCGRDHRVTDHGAARLLYHLVDEVVASHMPVVDALDAEMEEVEEHILASPSPAALPEVLRIKRALLRLRRIVAPQRETLNRLARDEIAVVPAAERVYFRDVYDHLVRQYDITEGLRDLAAGTLDTYLSVVNNRMNEVMKTFTLITTLFMPISFVTGFFGMNFFSPQDPPAGWTGRIVFGALCAAVVIIPTLMYTWLRRRRWV